MKKGQVTLFVILGIIIIFVLIGAYYITTQFSKAAAKKNVIQESEMNAEEIEAKNAIEDCISDLAEESILYTAARGGYFRPPSKFEFMNNVEIPYYLYKSDENIPSIETLQEQIALYIDANLENCVSNVNIIEKPSSTAALSENELQVETEMPVSIVDVSERRLNYYSIKIETRYKQVYDDAMEVYSKLSIIDNFQLVSLSELALDKDYEMRNAIDEDKIITLLLYKNYKIKETPLRFNFAIMHDSGKRIKADDVYSQNSLTEIVKSLQGLFALNEISSDEDYEAEEAKYEDRIMESIRNNPGGAK